MAPSSHVPSLALLTLLSAITPASSNPLPAPDFLCPSLIPQRKRSIRNQVRNPSTASTSTATAGFPVKYVQSTDGNWYIADSWSLHGRSKHQANFTSSASQPLPTYDHIAVDDLSDNPANSPIPTGIPASLPTGWKPMPTRTKFYSIPLVVVCSLILAISISLVIGCVVICHKRRRVPDNESKHSIKASPSIDQLTLKAIRAQEKGAAIKERMLSRWRRERRSGLRQRWRIPKRPDIEGEPRDKDNTVIEASIPLHDSSPRQQPIPTSPISIPTSTPTSSASPHSPLSYSSNIPFPPAYRRHSHLPMSPSEAEEDNHFPPQQTSAHVATDDKAVLARLYRGASAPALEEDDAWPGRGAAQAPEWVDERPEDFVDDDVVDDDDEERVAGQTSCHLRLPSPGSSVPVQIEYPGAPYYSMRDYGSNVEGSGLSIPSAPPVVVEEEVEASAPPLSIDHEVDDDSVVARRLPSYEP